MSEQHDKGDTSSSSSLSSCLQDTEDEKTTTSSLLDTEDETTVTNILSEEHVRADGRLGRRLSHLDSIPHTPRVNGVIPDVDDATLDHERLLERLSTYGLAELQVEGDGNCQFRALADQLFQNPEHHKHVRKHVVKQLKRFQNFYESYVPMQYKSYLKKMKRSGEWGDHLTLQAAADQFGAKICLLTSFKDTCFIEIVPRDQIPSRVKEVEYLRRNRHLFCDLFGGSQVVEILALVELLERGTLQFLVWNWRCAYSNNQKKALAFLKRL